MDFTEQLQHAQERLSALEAENAHLRAALELQGTALAEVRHERDLAQQYLDIAGVIVVAIGVDACVTYINAKGCEVLGVSPAGILGRNWYQTFVPARLRAEVIRASELLMAGEIAPVEYFENPVLRADGQELLIAWHNTVLRDATGRIVGTLSSGEDITERRRAEEALQESEARFRTLFDAIADGLVVERIEADDSPGPFLEVNDVICRRLGYTREELLHMAPRDIDAPPSEGGADPIVIFEAILTGREITFEQIHLAKDGRRIPVEIAGKPIIFQGQRALFALVRDISQRKETERALYLAQFSVDHAGEMIFWLDFATGGLSYANEAACQRLGYTRAEFARMSVFDIDPVFTVKKWPAHRKNLRAHGSLLFESRHRAKSGEIFSVEVSAGYATFDGAEYIFAYVRDISERKRLQEALEESESLFRMLAETTQALIYIRQGSHVLYSNPSAVRFTGYSVDELLRQDIFLLAHPDDRARLKDYAKQRLAGEAVPARFEVRVLTKAGAMKWLEISPTVIEWQGAPAILTTAYDITERKAALEELAARKRFLEYLLDSVPLAIFWKDRQSGYLGCNVVFARAVGLDAPAAIVGKTDFDLPWASGEAEAYRADDEEVMASNRPKRHIVETLQQADGTRMWIETTKVPLADAAGRVYGMLGIYEDITERKATAESLVESRTMLQLILDTIPVRVFWKDRQSVYQGCNLPFAQDTGLPTPVAIIGRTDFDMAFREQANLYRADDRAVIESGVARLNYEERQTRPDGIVSWLRTSKIPLRNSEGAVIGVLGVYEDISEKKAAEEALQRTNRALRMLSNSNQILIRAAEEAGLLEAICGSIVKDGGYRMVWIGLRRDPTDTVPWPVASAGVTDGYLEYLIEHCSGAVSDGFPTVDALQSGRPVVVADLADRAGDAHIGPWRDEALQRGYRGLVALPLVVHGDTLGTLTLFTHTVITPDPVELHLLAELADDVAFGIDALRTRASGLRAMDDLRSERAFLAASIDILPLPVFYLLPTRRVARTNRAAQQMLGSDDEQQWMAVELRYAESKALLSSTERPSARALRGEKVVNIELLLRFPDGREMPALVSAAPVYLDSQPAAAVVVIQEITQLKEADRAKDQFLITLSHELKTPLTAIIGWAQLAQDTPELVDEALIVIRRNAQLQKMLLERLIMLSRILTDRLVIVMKPTDPWLIALSALHSFQEDAAAREITVTVIAPEEALTLMADPLLLERAICEVLDNATHFTRPGGTITVQGQVTADSFTLVIQDTGEGISPELPGQLTKPFSQLLRREEIGGVGIGLAIVRGILEAHHGRITIASAGVGQGTTVTLFLPRMRGG